MTDLRECAEHTPAPVKISAPKGGFSEILGPNNELIFALAIGHGEECQPPEVCEANARFLERAWNNHDKLITALEEATKALGPLAGKIYNDNGDITYSNLSVPATASECKAAYFAQKRARDLIAQSRKAKGE